ncbi:hypothetical protein QTJ16_002886 [Diplocarpon rosae]|uniref:Glycoside hydrolase family 93 protein n=1 Tax=Diplocarpon rosae TaxID=946125 RepID=A0AAD9T2M0_9HELO|nr:hypothetical protein QTJ16_002886 [Diplocarpon rosae]PBP25776.1 BNR/Asp-box repeat domain containing protein [Diplocarpon rosae]
MFGPKFIATVFALATSISPALSAPSFEHGIKPRAVTYKPVSAKAIFIPPEDYNTPKTLYARSVQLDDGTLLATWEIYAPGPPLVGFPIYQSTDGGSTWAAHGLVTDKVNGWGMRYQPFLYVLPKALGKLAKGTILLAGNSIPENLSRTKIDIYASTNGGTDWDFVSSVASGGEAKPSNGPTPVWEPFLMMYGDHLVVYYSDQSDPEHGQKLCHKTSPDGVNWGPVVNDVAYPDYDRRPGMATIAEFKGHYILTYENVGGDSPSGTEYPIYYRISDNPLKFDTAPEHMLQAGEDYPSSSPTVTWSSAGGEHGTIIVSADSHSDIFINTNLGDPLGWVKYASPQDSAYSREVRVLSDPEWLLIIGAGVLNGNNFVSNSILKLPNL